MRVRPIKVLIVDSQLLLADALVRVLSQAPGFTVFSDTPTNGPDAVKAVVAHRPDVALIDYWLEGMDAWAPAQALLSRLPHLKIIHLSWFHGPTQVEDSLASGAVGFLPKKLPVAKIEEAIRRAHGGENPVFEAGPTTRASNSSSTPSSSTRRSWAVVGSTRYMEPFLPTAQRRLPWTATEVLM